MTASMPVNDKPLPLHNHLPHETTTFIGREGELALIRSRLQQPEVRLLTLTGPGGIGKTRLALSVASQAVPTYDDGVFFVGLASIRDSGLVMSSIATVLGVKEGGESLQKIIGAFLRDRHILLVLDNFEQVVEAAPHVADLLAATQYCKILVTSRVRLRLAEEVVYAVPPLAIASPDRQLLFEQLSRNEAIRLFVTRAQAADTTFTFTPANAPAVAAICYRLDGLPLAIELAAARVRLLPPQALLARLEQRLPVLTGGARNAPLRHQTLRNTIDWSYNLLTASERTLFRRLAVFVGSCTLEAVEAVCSKDPDAQEHHNGKHTDSQPDTAQPLLEGLQSLLDKSLVQPEVENTTTLDSMPRFHMLATIREYAVERLQASDEAEILRSRHAAYYLRFAETASPELIGPDVTEWLERLEHDHDNARAALDYALLSGDMATAGRLCAALGYFWSLRGHWTEGRRWVTAVLGESPSSMPAKQSAERQITPAVRARVLHAVGTLAEHQNDLAAAQAYFEASLSLQRELGNRSASAWLLLELAGLHGYETPQARKLLEEALAAYRELNEKDGLAWSAHMLGWAYELRGDHTRAEELAEEAWSLFRSIGNKIGILNSLTDLGYIAEMRGMYALAHTRYQQALELTDAVADTIGMASSLRRRGSIARKEGQWPEAQALLDASRELSERADYQYGVALAYHELSLVALDQDDLTTARQLAEQCLGLVRATGDRTSIGAALNTLGTIRSLDGEPIAAQACFTESLTLAQEFGLRGPGVAALEGIASLAGQRGEAIAALRLAGAATSIRHELGEPLPPGERLRFETTVNEARSMLIPAGGARAWAEGKTMSTEETIQTARSVLNPNILPTSAAHSVVEPSPAYPANLTEREIEVLRLVAQGLTDKAIGSQLFVSHHTVNMHLRAIYGKLGVNSRAAATRWYFEHDLL